MASRLKPSAPLRSVTEVGPGDYIKVGVGVWKQIASTTAQGQSRPPSWTVRTTDGQSYNMFTIHRYAKSSDLE